MAEALALAGVAGGGSGGIGDAIGRIIGDLERALARFGSSVVTAFKSVIDKVMAVASRVARIIERYFRIAVHYVVLFLRLGYRYMYKFYTEFQKDPWRTLQFIGTIAILINNNLYP
jgi:deoxyxylulose-5-phosphate synthase